MIQKDGYFYNHQITTYILQFMAIFQGLQVMVGKTDERDEALISVPVHYAQHDRVVAAIIAGNTTNTPLRLPVMTAYMTGLSPDAAPHGLGLERRNSYVPIGGLVPDDITVVTQRKPVKCELEIDLRIYTSNIDQHFQLIEQIFPLFNPQLTIQTSDGVLDWTRLTSVERVSSSFNPYDELGQRRQVQQSTHSFKMPIYIDTPAQVHKEFVEKIFLRVGAVSTAALDNRAIISELDAQGIDYTLVKDGDDLDLG